VLEPMPCIFNRSVVSYPSRGAIKFKKAGRINPINKQAEACIPAVSENKSTLKPVIKQINKRRVLFIVEDCILNNEVYFINLDTEKKFVVGWKCDVKELVNYD
jgi:signal transduction histidine kinase